MKIITGKEPDNIKEFYDQTINDNKDIGEVTCTYESCIDKPFGHNCKKEFAYILKATPDSATNKTDIENIKENIIEMYFAHLEGQLMLDLMYTEKVKELFSEITHYQVAGLIIEKMK